MDPEIQHDILIRRAVELGCKIYNELFLIEPNF